MAFKITDSANKFLPYDENAQWREIYVRLEQSMGAALAHSWFGYCKFVRLQSDTIELSHWTRFGARECAHRYGAELCKAANVSNVKIYRSGGHVPVHITTPITARAGYEQFQHRDAA